MINGIHHTALSCSDMEQSLRFYRDLLGAEVVFDGGWKKGNEVADRITRLQDGSCRQVMLCLGNAYLELFQYFSPQPQSHGGAPRVCDHGWTHVCFDVSDIQSEYQRVVEADVDVHCAPQQVGKAVYSFYMRDPDGNVIEFQEVKPDTADDRVIGLPSFTRR